MQLTFIPKSALRPLMIGVLVSAILFFLYGVLGPNPLYTFPGLALFGVFCVLMEQYTTFKTEQERHAAVMREFAQLNQIAEGRQWLGRESKIVHRFDAIYLSDESRRYQHYRWPLLCKTEKGAWFLLEVDTQGAKVLTSTVEPVTDEHAARLLASEPALYTANFGKPEIA